MKINSLRVTCHLFEKWMLLTVTRTQGLQKNKTLSLFIVKHITKLLIRLSFNMMIYSQIMAIMTEVYGSQINKCILFTSRRSYLLVSF